VIAQYMTALRLSLVEQKHNRFAMLLLVLYLPAWYAIIYSIEGSGSIGFNLRALGAIVTVGQQRLGLITGMLNATTLIMGFVALRTVRASSPVDRRLVLCGHSRAALVIGRLTALAVAAVVVATYAVALLQALTPLRHFGVVWAGACGAVLTYAAIGVLVGVLTRGDLDGFFLIIMLSLVDTFLQNPIGSPAANSRLVEYFPTFYPMQMTVAAAFTDRIVWWQAWASLGWAVGVGAFGVIGFVERTRTAGRRSGVAAPSRQSGLLSP
jgi:ABC-2 type transport system permease protein